MHAFAPPRLPARTYRFAARAAFASLVPLAVFACSARPDDVAPREAREVGDTTAAERWNNANNPAFVDPSFRYIATSLPVEGASRFTPIPGDYWPTYRDSINARWDGPESLSPAEKYEQAFNRPGTAAVVSRTYGINAYSGRKSCTTAADCSDLADGSACAIARGETTGRCIPTWWGICHGWAPYSYLEPAATRPVTRNGVTFYPGDIEGLMSLVYSEGLRIRFLSERCNTKTPEVDDQGRLVESACRDMNPGAVHVVLANLLGLRQSSLVFDSYSGDQVWTFPIRSFRVTNAQGGRLLEVTKPEAIALLAGTGDEYALNPDAKRFFHVVAQLRYVNLTRASRESHVGDVDSYTGTEYYEYVLEADQAGTIIGGEWLGSSRTQHADFAWWPVSGPPASVARGYIRYSEVKSLNDEAASPAPTPTPDAGADAQVDAGPSPTPAPDAGNDAGADPGPDATADASPQ